MTEPSPRPQLLAVDLGLRTGLALFDADGYLLQYHSQHFANRAALKRQLYGTLEPMRPLLAIATEGDPHLAALWSKLPLKWGARHLHVQAHTWRERLLKPREREHGGALAKQHAQRLALATIAHSPHAPRPHGELRHDAAEAILLGVWAGLELGLIDPEDTAGPLPPELRPLP